MKKLLVRYILPALAIILLAWFFVKITEGKVQNPPLNTDTIQTQVLPKSPTPTPSPITPSSHIIPIRLHTFQTFNNCGPATLSMILSYLDINVSQQTLGQSLRPYQNPRGDNDDKSVTLQELATEAQKYNLLPYHRPNGNIQILKQFIANGIPVITRTLTKPTEDIGHYRLVRGYDDTTGQIIQDDSLQNKNLRFSYGDFTRLWQDFNFEYLVLVPKEKEEVVEGILGEDIDEKMAWQKAAESSEAILAQNPNDTVARFNLSVALYNIGDFQGSVREFEKVENRLPFRTLWYQIEPVQAYFELGNYDRVFQLTDKILSNYNRAFSELYLIRGEIYKKKGRLDLAKTEFEKAVLYNKNLKSAQEALGSLSS